MDSLCAWVLTAVCCLVVCRYTYLLDLAQQHGQPLLMVGASGTGKTSIIAAHILNGGLPQDLWIPVCVTLSSRTSANMLQEQVRSCSSEEVSTQSKLLSGLLFRNIGRAFDTVSRHHRHR